MVPCLEVRFDLQTGDLYWLIFSDAIRKLTYARWILAIALIILVALGTQYVTLLAVLLLPPVIYLLVGGLIYAALVLPYLRSRAVVRATMGTSSTASCAIGPQGVDVRRQGTQAHYDWAIVRNAKQTSSLILIYFDGHSALVIPKRCFASSQQLHDFRSIVATYVKSVVSQRYANKINWLSETG